MSDSDSPATPPPKKRGRKKNSMSKPRHTKLMVPDIQGPRPSAPKPVFLSQAKWKTLEKRQLLRALRQCVSEDDVVKVYSMVPTRAREEVEAEILRLRNSVVQHGPDLQAPVETWLDFAEELVHYEDEDHSRSLGRAMSIVSNYETFQAPPGPATPDYKTLYKYIAAVLNGIEPPKLSPLDSAIVLDLMHSMADVLSSTNTATQRCVMKWKFSMLNCKVDINNLADSAARVRKALTNVFPEEFSIGSSTAGRKSQVKVQTEGLCQASTSQQMSNSGGSQQANEKMSQTPVQFSVSQQTAKSDPSSTHTGPPANGNTLQTEGVPLSDTSKLTSNPDPSSVHSNPDHSRTSRETTLSNTGPNRTGVARFEEPPKKRGRGRGRSRQGDPPLEKPQLYSLNPFCVPVDILKLNRTKRKERVMYKPL